MLNIASSQSLSLIFALCFTSGYSTPMMARLYVGFFHARGSRSFQPPLPPGPPPPPSSSFMGALVALSRAVTVTGLPPRDTVNETVSPESLLRSRSRSAADEVMTSPRYPAAVPAVVVVAAGESLSDLAVLTDL